MSAAGTLESEIREVVSMARSSNPDRGRPKRRHRRNSAGRLEIPYDPALDDRTFLEEVERSEPARD